MVIGSPCRENPYEVFDKDFRILRNSFCIMFIIFLRNINSFINHLFDEGKEENKTCYSTSLLRKFVRKNIMKIVSVTLNCISAFIILESFKLQLFSAKTENIESYAHSEVNREMRLKLMCVVLCFLLFIVE